MAAFVKYEVFSENLAEKVHDLNADVLKVMLSNSAPNVATHELRSQVTELGGGSGYTSGGTDTQNTTSRSGGTTSVVGIDFTFTASAGTIGPFRYAILYNDTPSSPLDPLIGYWDYGSSISLLDGETLDVDFGASLFTIA
jgi:hypothetical protein